MCQTSDMKAEFPRQVLKQVTKLGDIALVPSSHQWNMSTLQTEQSEHLRKHSHLTQIRQSLAEN